jgi:cytochrome c oxidase assembly protein subunit 15
MLLTWIALRQLAQVDQVGAGVMKSWRGFSQFGLVLVLVQIMLGGWVSANFAGLACTEFPLCKGSLLPPMDFSFNLERYGSPLSDEKLTAIHLIHRVGALLTILYLSWLSFRVMAVEGLHKIGKAMLGLVVFQFVLGISNVLLGLPLAGAVLHNVVAMLLLVTLVWLYYSLRKQEI